MKYEQPMLEQNPKRLVRNTYLMLLLNGALTILMTLSLLAVLTNRIDERAETDIRERLSLIMAEWQSALQLAVEDHAYWTLAYQSILRDDADAIYENIGSAATESELFDWIVILNADGTVQRAYNFPPAVEVEDALNSEKTSTLLSMLGAHDPIDYLSVSSAIEVGQDVSLISAAWVTPDNMRGLDASQLPVIIGGVMFKGQRLAKLEQSVGADAVVLVAAPPNETEIAYEFDSPFDIINHLSLTPMTPGSDLRKEILPWLMIFCSAVSLVTLLVARYFRQLAVQLNRSIVLASTDPLTGLSNRVALQSLIESPLIGHALDHGYIAVINLDLNRFKQLNDQHGHAVGDVALQFTAKRLRNAVRKSDRVARIGGDEFLCLIVDQAPKQAVEKIADRIVSAFNEPIDFGSFKCDLHASIGIAVGGVGDSWDDLVRRADAAMYQAKRREKGLPVFHQISEVV